MAQNRIQAGWTVYTFARLPHSTPGTDTLRSMKIAAVVWLTAGLAAAQWINYPTAGVPKNADGSPNLNAPAPRGADGKPDLSGVWLLEKNQPCPKEGCNDMEITKEFMNVGWNLPGHGVDAVGAGGERWVRHHRAAARVLDAAGFHQAAREDVGNRGRADADVDGDPRHR